MRSLKTGVHALYDSLADVPIHPFVGASYERPSAADLRVLGVGINSYISPDGWKGRHPDWFSSWFKEGSWPFYVRAWAEIQVLAAALASAPRFGDRRLPGKDGVYLTNAIKVYLSKKAGRHAADVTFEHFQKYTGTWRAELDLLAEHEALPHLIVVFGEAPWDHVYPALQAGAFSHFSVESYRPIDGDLYHRCNRLVLTGKAGRHPLMLVRIAHPAARSSRWKAAGLAAHPDFLRALSEPV